MRDNPRGRALIAQATVETLATFLILVLCAFGLPAVGWAALERSQVEYAIAHVGDHMSPDLGGDPDEVVADMIARNSFFIDRDRLRVEKAEIDLDGYSLHEVGDGSSASVRSARSMTISAEITYTYDRIVPLFSPVTYTTRVDRKVTVQRDYQTL